MTTTVSEYEYGNPLTTQKPRNKQKAPVSMVAVIIGLLVLAMAVAEMYFGISWLYKKWIRLSSWAAIGAFLTQPPERDHLLVQLGIGEAAMLIWWYAEYALAGVLGLTGLWVATRRRFGWRMLWFGAIAAILAGGLTVVSGYILEHYAGFPPQDKRTYAIAFLIHSAPGWVILLMWLTCRLFLRNSTPRQQPDNPSDAATKPAS